MYSLDRKNYQTFETLDKLIDHCLDYGICPSVKVTINGKTTGETVADFLQY